MKFHEKLQTLRKEKGLTQEKFAEILKVTRQAVSKWENGEGYPEIEKILYISQYFTISLDDLFDNQQKNHNPSLLTHSLIEQLNQFYINLTKNQRIFVQVIAWILLLSTIYILGNSVGSHIGTFVYNITH